jgi:hypothetical protein
MTRSPVDADAIGALTVMVFPAVFNEIYSPSVNCVESSTKNDTLLLTSAVSLAAGYAPWGGPDLLTVNAGLAFAVTLAPAVREEEFDAVTVAEFGIFKEELPKGRAFIVTLKATVVEPPEAKVPRSKTTLLFTESKDPLPWVISLKLVLFGIGSVTTTLFAALDPEFDTPMV